MIVLLTHVNDNTLIHPLTHVNDNTLRALLKNANAIFKPFLAFYGSKCVASKDAKHRNAKKFYNSATIQFYL